MKNEVRQGKIRNIQNLKKKINEGKNSSRKNTERDVKNPNQRKKQLELAKKDNKKNYKYHKENNKQQNSVNEKIKFKNGLKICPKCNYAQNKINKICPKCYHMFE